MCRLCVQLSQPETVLGGGQNAPIIVAQADPELAAPVILVVPNHGEMAFAFDETGQLVRFGVIETRGGFEPGVEDSFTAWSTSHLEFPRRFP